jgi:hypothetical protein
VQTKVAMPGIAAQTLCAKGQKKPTNLWLYEFPVMFGGWQDEWLCAALDGVDLV